MNLYTRLYKYLLYYTTVPRQSFRRVSLPPLSLTPYLLYSNQYLTLIHIPVYNKTDESIKLEKELFFKKKIHLEVWKNLKFERGIYDT